MTRWASVALSRNSTECTYCGGGVNGLPFCKQMMRCALRLTGREASIRLVVSLVA